jgi:IS30 family transposase
MFGKTKRKKENSIYIFAAKVERIENEVLTKTLEVFLNNRISIGQRPDIVEKRTRFGDLEVDLIIRKNHNQAILTIHNRACGVLKTKKLAPKESSVVAAVVHDLLEERKLYLYTITADNEKRIYRT